MDGVDCIVFSPYVLKDHLPANHYNMWCLFSFACSLLCRPFIREAELLQADQLLLDFCKAFERVFGKECVTPNMHLHAHLKECIYDMGPVFSFWCFSFERYNGILESFQKNWHAPELQIIQKFILMQTLNSVDVTSAPAEISSCLGALRKNVTMLEDARRIFDSKQLFNYERNLLILPTAVCAIKLDCHRIIPPIREKFFVDSVRQNLHGMYSVLYGAEAVNHVPLRYEECTQVEVFGKLFTSLKSRSRQSSAVMAVWRSVIGKIIVTDSDDVRIRMVEYFAVHVPCISGFPDQAHLLAKVRWYEDHPRKFWFKNSIVLSATLFDGESEAAFIPVSRIMSRCATIKRTLTFDYGEDSVIVCIPLIRRLSMN